MPTSRIERHGIRSPDATAYPRVVKQMGSRFGTPGKGGDMSLWPADLRVREYPHQLARAVA